MAASLVDTLIFAPLAPLLGVLLFWFIQLIFIESEKYLLSTIWDTHQSFCRFSNFIGVFFQVICQALGYTVTRSGISEVHLSVADGEVTPKKEKTGVAEWFSNALLFIGPFFLPALLLLVSLFFLRHDAFTFPVVSDFTFMEGLTLFGTSLFVSLEKMLSFLSTMDLFNPIHVGFLLLLIFVGLGIRPSYLGERRKEKIDMMYDLRNIKELILYKPWYIIILFVIVYAVCYVSFVAHTNWYLSIYLVLGWLSLLAIVALVIAHLLTLLIRASDAISGYRRIVPFLMMPLSYALARGMFFIYPQERTTTLSLIIMAIVTAVVTVFLIARKTNTFKTKKKMKPTKVKDAKRRSSQE